MKTIEIHRRVKSKPRLIFYMALMLNFFPWFSGVKNADAEDGSMPFRPGEKLTFELKWSVIRAGKAVIEVLPIETVNGEDAYHFLMTVRTTSFVDHFYKVRDRIDAYCDVGMNRSIFFKKKQREGRSKRDVLVTFDWDKNQAQYSNFGKKREPISILPGTFDPYSAFYFTRLFNWEKGNEIKRPVTDGKKMITGKARLIKRETITVPSGTYDTFLIEPNIEHVGGVFEKSKNAKIELWVTADARRIPVRLKSKVVVGSFVGELISLEGTDKP
jgi:hypothetical protein